MEAVDTGMVTEWPQTLVWAAFATPDGAIDALERLQAARSTWRIRIDNAAVVVKHADGGIAVNETGCATPASKTTRCARSPTSWRRAVRCCWP
jgi:uncharacterized membrane protein